MNDADQALDAKPPQAVWQRTGSREWRLEIIRPPAPNRHYLGGALAATAPGIRTAEITVEGCSFFGMGAALTVGPAEGFSIVGPRFRYRQS